MRNYDNAYRSYLDQRLWTQLGPGQWRHASVAVLDVTSSGRPANRWTLTAAAREWSGTGVRDLDALLGQLGLRGAGGRRSPKAA